MGLFFNMAHKLPYDTMSFRDTARWPVKSLHSFKFLCGLPVCQWSPSFEVLLWGSVAVCLSLRLMLPAIILNDSTKEREETETGFVRRP